MLLIDRVWVSLGLGLRLGLLLPLLLSQGKLHREQHCDIPKTYLLVFVLIELGKISS